MTRIIPMDYHYEVCPLCHTKKPYGPHRYELKKSKLGIFLCLDCISANHDGLAPQFESTIRDLVGEENFKNLERNDNGLIII